MIDRMPVDPEVPWAWAVFVSTLVCIALAGVVMLFAIWRQLPAPDCGACRYNVLSACKRYPPYRVYTGDTQKNPDALDVTVWPVVQPGNWCGEFKEGRKS